MSEAQFLKTEPGRTIAYHKSAGQGPGVVFLGGLRSDMTGTKALYLQDWAQSHGRAFLRFDYSGHGASGGAFEDGCIGDWLADAQMVLALTEGRQVLVGSSMGGWIALLIARDMPEMVAGLVTVAAAPDFTDAIEAGMAAAERREMARTGRIAQPSDYGDAYVITRKLIEDGRNRRIFDRPLNLSMPVRFLQGMADADVPAATAMRLLDHATGPDMRLTLVKGADHRFSTPDCLRLIETSVTKVSARSG